MITFIIPPNLKWSVPQKKNKSVILMRLLQFPLISHYCKAHQPKLHFLSYAIAKIHIIQLMMGFYLWGFNCGRTSLGSLPKGFREEFNWFQKVTFQKFFLYSESLTGFSDVLHLHGEFSNFSGCIIYIMTFAYRYSNICSWL